MKRQYHYLLCTAVGLWLGTTAMVATDRQSATTGESAVAATQGWRTIATVENISVQVPVGCVPRLPWQVWVKYTDGYGEYNRVCRSLEDVGATGCSNTL